MISDKHDNIGVDIANPGHYWTWYNKVGTILSGNEEIIMLRKTFDKAFKLSAVKLILEEEQSVKIVSSTLEIHPTFKIEFVYQETLQSLEELTLKTKNYVHWWNHHSIHGSLNYQTPMAKRVIN